MNNFQKADSVQKDGEYYSIKSIPSPINPNFILFGEKGEETKSPEEMETFLLNDMVEKLEELLHGNAQFKSLYIYDKFGSMYLRGINPMMPKNVQGIIIANINIHKHLQKQGRFTKLLSLIEIAAKRLNVFSEVECVHNPILAKFLEKRGYIKNQQNWKRYH